MTRALCGLAGICALALILLAQAVKTTPIRVDLAPSAPPSSQPAPAMADPATAIEDLAAWPGAAGR